MITLTFIQEMQPKERADWLRKTWGVELKYSAFPPSYPMDILRNGQRIGGIVLSNNRVIIELHEIGELDSDKAYGADALEIWECEIGITTDDEAESINARIYYFVGVWAEKNLNHR